MSKWITVLTVSYPQQLWVIRTKLESEDIECFIKDELTVQSYNLYSNAVGGVKLQVLEDDVERARKILEELDYIKEEPIRVDLLTEADKKTLSIPFLKNLSVSHRIIIITLLFVTFLTTLIYFIVRPSLYDQLVSNSWCVNKIYYKNMHIGPKTNAFVVFTDMDGHTDCADQMRFDKNNEVVLPGINTMSVKGHWREGDDIVLTTDSLKQVFEGVYKADITGNLLTLKSTTTIIYAYRDDYRMPTPF